MNLRSFYSAMDYIAEAAEIDELYQQSSGDPIFYGLPHTKQYPMPDEKHVRSAIKFFNYVSADDEEELANNINKMIKKYKITDLNVGPNNRFKNYYAVDESIMTQTAPIVPYTGSVLVKPGYESLSFPSKDDRNESDVGKGLSYKAASLNQMKLHPVYVILIHSGSGFSKFIKLMTNAPYTHACIAFDSTMNKTYSFCGREGHKMIPYGMACESMSTWVRKNPDCKYALYVLYVDDEDYRLMQSKVREMWGRRTEFRYDVGGVVKTFFGMKNANSTKYFCSGFVAYILNSGKTQRTKTSYDMVKPMDIPDVPDLHLVDMGLAKDYNQAHVDKTVLNIYNTKYAKKLESAEKQKQSENKPEQKPMPTQNPTRPNQDSLRNNTSVPNREPNRPDNRKIPELSNNKT